MKEPPIAVSPLLCTAVLICALSPSCFAQPLKVFILAGQSSMEGHAEIRTFDYIGKDPATAPLLKDMRNPDGTPRVCDNVWMSYLTGPYDGSANDEGLGKLTAGFGERGDNPTRLSSKIHRPNGPTVRSRPVQRQTAGPLGLNDRGGFPIPGPVAQAI